MAKNPSGKWEFTIETNPATDEHSGEPGVLGLFFEKVCIMGVIIRPHGYAKKRGYPDYGPFYGLIICNRFAGLWQEKAVTK